MIYNTFIWIRGDLAALGPAGVVVGSVAFRNRHLSTPLHVSALRSLPLVETFPAEGNCYVPPKVQDAPDDQTRADHGYRDHLK
ncbi:hypothetical protein [Mycolicibacterium sp. GF69]|uniref:hypothetical protein n=1 Tax=Mycolicibacterium sp. GF69 TaxID=2267251 RepID=UPI001057E9BF|nr:hypothetical protein [Mycolicibacterium sp. GF69]